MNEHDAIEQLAALLDGEAATDAAPDSLGALATLATTVRDHADLMAPTPEFRASLREELVAAAELPPGLVDRARMAWTARTANLRASARVAVATLTASSMIGTAGVAVAAQEALPGDVLYGLKGITEDARLLLATSDVAQARLHLAFARERLAELQAMSGQLTADEVVAILAEMDAHSAAGARALIDAVAAGAVDPAEVRDFATHQRFGLVAMLGDLPLLAKPVAEDSLELLRRIEVTAFGTTTAAGGDCNCDPAADRAHIGHALDPARGRLEPRLDTARALLPTETVITAPGDGPAVPQGDCDCIELPGGPASREPTDEGTARKDTPDDSEPEQEPFQPTGELTSPETSNDDEDEDTGLDAPDSGGDVPVSRTIEPIEDTSGIGVDTSPVDRATDSLLDD